MTAKEYLAQVRLIDTRINNKLAQVSELRDLATKATSVLSDMPRGDSPNQQSMEGIVVKIVDMEKRDQWRYRRADRPSNERFLR